MDTNTIMAFLIALILIIIVNEISEGIPLVLVGFFIMAFAWNLTSIFAFSSSDLAGWGNVIILGYWIIAVFAFLKAGYEGYDHGLVKKRHSHE